MADSYESPRNFMAGDLVEVLIWGRTLNPSERLEVGYYLANKYGIDDAVYDDNGYFAIRNLPPANCEEIWSFQLDGRVPADFNRDCIVNIMDLGVIAEQWLMSSGL
jgi:hypothetical protein